MDAKKYQEMQRFRAKRHQFRNNPDRAREDITEFLQEDFTNIPFVVLNFSVYCRVPYITDLHFIPGEVGLVAFTINEGIIDSFSTLIDPGKVPIGARGEVKESIERSGLKIPGYDPRLQDLKTLVKNIDDFMRKHSSVKTEWPPVFCMESELESFYGCMDWLYADTKIPGPPEEFRLRPLEMALHRASVLGRIFQDAEDGIDEVEETKDVQDIRERFASEFGIGGHMIPVVSRRTGEDLIKFDEDRFPLTPAETLLVRIGKFADEKHALEYLRSTRNAYNNQLACEYHRRADAEEKDGLTACSELVTKRLAINSVDALKSLFIIE